jgi:hypothetical protein
VFCVVTLAAGALLAPPTFRTAVPVSQERAAPLLEEQIQPRGTPRSVEAVHDVRDRVRQFSAALLSKSASVTTTNDFSFSALSRPPLPDGLGVFISGDHVLTHVDGLNGRSTMQLATHDGRTVSADMAAYEPSTGLVLLRTAASRR